MLSVHTLVVCALIYLSVGESKTVNRRSAHHEDLDTKVKHGKIATQGYPWLVSLKVGGDSLCGGALIHPQYVLTAAHCIRKINKDKQQLTEVHIGSKSLYKGYSARVEKHIPHPSYRPQNDLTMYDIGLLKLSAPVPADQGTPIPIPTEGGITTEYGGKSAMVVGWGRTEDAGITSMLREGIVNLVNNKDCRRQAISDYQICANVDENQPIACHGDSGGPVVLQTGKDKFIQIGIVSYGTPALGKEHCFNYDIYTKVVGYLSWISETIAQN